MIVSCLAARSAFPYETEKAAALPVVKHIETSSKDLYLLGGHRYWCSETSGRSRKYEHKKCPELLLGRLSPPLERTALYMFDGGKGTKKSRTSKEIRDFFLYPQQKSEKFTFFASPIIIFLLFFAHKCFQTCH